MSRSGFCFSVFFLFSLCKLCLDYIFSLLQKQWASFMNRLVKLGVNVFIKPNRTKNTSIKAHQVHKRFGDADFRRTHDDQCLNQI